MDEDRKIFIKRAEERYFKIGKIPCPALGMAGVYFNKHGFEHLLIKEGKLRKKPDQARKIHLSQKAPEILEASTVWSKYTKNTRTNRRGEVVSIAEFWEFSREYPNRIVTVIVRKINAGEHHFFSIKDKK